MPTKLSPDKIDIAKRRRKRGVSFAAIAKELGVAKSTVHEALARPKPKKLPPPRPIDVEPIAELELPPAPTLEQLAADLAHQLAELREDARRARAARDGEALARAQRHMVVTATVLARLTRDAPSADGVVEVKLSEMQAEGDRARERLIGYIERTIKKVRETGTLPKPDPEQSPAHNFVVALVAFAPVVHAMLLVEDEPFHVESVTALLDCIWSKCTTTELAALENDWRNFWARPKQVIP